MKAINTNNYFEAVTGFDWSSVHPDIREVHETLVVPASDDKWAVYQSTPEVKEEVDAHFKEMQGILAKRAPAPPAESPAKKKRERQPAKVKTPRAAKAKPAAQPKEAKPAGAKLPALPANTLVEHVANDVAFIKRVAKMAGKVVKRDALLSLLHGIQKAMLEGRITRKSDHDALITLMQANLLKAVNHMAAENMLAMKIDLSADRLKQCREIAASENQRPTVKLLKKYIAISGKRGVKEQARKLYRDFEKAAADGTITENDKYVDQADDAFKTLHVYINEKSPVLKIHPVHLNGLAGITGTFDGAAGLAGVPQRNDAPGLFKKKSGVANRASGLAGTDVPYITESDLREAARPRSGGLNGFGEVAGAGPANRQAPVPAPVKPAPAPSPAPASAPSVPQGTGRIMSAGEVSRMNFKTIGLQGKYRALIGDPEPGFAMMIYAKPKSGKSTFAIDFAKHLAQHHGKSLYCAVEEGFGLTLKDKIQRMGASNIANLHFANGLPGSLAGYDFVFIDSVNDAGLDPEAMKNLRAKNPGVSFIDIHHVTKAGTFRGSQQAAHDVDVMIEIKDGVAYSQGRFGPPAEMPVSQGVRMSA